MSYIVRRYWAHEYLVHCSCDDNGKIHYQWHYKQGSAHQFETKAAAEAIAFMVNGLVEEAP